MKICRLRSAAKTFLSRARYDHKLRERGHNFVSPRSQNNIYKISFLNKCLFSIV